MDGTEISKKLLVPVLLLKTKSTPNDGYEEKFLSEHEGHSYEPVFIPVLEHKFLEDGLTVVRDLLQQKKIGSLPESKYGGMIFTSQRAVEAFAKLVDEGNVDDGWPYLQDVPIYTVGPATSRALRSISQTPPLQIFGSETGNGEALAHYMLDHYGKWYHDQPVKPPLLFLVGDQRRDIIPKTMMDPTLSNGRRVQVDEVVIYGTGVMQSFEQDFTQIVEDLDTAIPKWVVVFSPTGCEAMLRSLNMLETASGKVKELSERVKPCNTYIATIGPTTRDYLHDTFGYDADVCAEKPSPEGVEVGIRQFMNQKR